MEVIQTIRSGGFRDRETIDTILPNSPEIESARMYARIPTVSQMRLAMRLEEAKADFWRKLEENIPNQEPSLNDFLYDKFLDDMAGTSYDPDDVEEFDIWLQELGAWAVGSTDGLKALTKYMLEYFGIWAEERFGW